MALNSPELWLVAYDIADPKRLSRLHRFMKREGTPIQYSLFGVVGSARRIMRLKERIAGLIEPDEDDVRIYRLPRRLDYSALGAPLLPQELLLYGDGGQALTLFQSQPPAERGRR